MHHSFSKIFHPFSSFALDHFILFLILLYRLSQNVLFPIYSILLCSIFISELTRYIVPVSVDDLAELLCIDE